MDLGKRNYKARKILLIENKILDELSIPEFIEKFIVKGFEKEENVIIVGHEGIINNFTKCKNKLNYIFNNEKMKVFTYDLRNNDILQFNYIISEILKIKKKVRIIWDLRSLLNNNKSLSKLLFLLDQIENINKNIYNVFYIPNNIYEKNCLKEIFYKFKLIVILDRNRQLYLKSKEDFDNYIWFLQSIAILEHQNNNLVLFNDQVSNIPKISDVEIFKIEVLNKIKSICNMDFCIMYTSPRENKTYMDTHFGITKKHEYFLMNDNEFIEYQIKLNEYVMNNKQNMYMINVDQILNKKLKKRLDEVNLISLMGVYVNYYDKKQGVIWVGRYEKYGKIAKENLEYIESICKTAFYLIQQQKNFLEMRNRLIENEKLKAMGEVAAGIAHDINNILTPIVGSVEILKDKVDDRKVLKDLEIIDICAKDGMNITKKAKNNLKCYNNIGKWSKFNIDNVIKDTIDLVENKCDICLALNNIKINISKNLKSNAKIKGNITEIREVLLNILNNSIDAMPKGGKINIETEVIGKEVRIKVVDNGMGMDEEVRNRIFEPFFTTKGDKGSGIGMSLSYKIIKSHKGTMEFKSKKDIGTCFNIYLPIANEENYNNKKNKIDNKINEINQINFNGNVLVIDDKKMVRKVVLDMIKNTCNAKVKSCSNENIKEEICRRKYDIIICDFSMPGINGLEVATLCKNLNSKCFFCLMTGWIGDFDENKIKDIDFILEKPIDNRKINMLFERYNLKSVNE